MNSNYFLDVSLELGAFSRKTGISARSFKNHVMKTVSSLFGQVGRSEVVELLKYDQQKQRGIFMCRSSFYVKLRGAITLTGKFEGFNCTYIVHKVSPSLLSLLADSRTFHKDSN